MYSSITSIEFGIFNIPLNPEQYENDLFFIDFKLVGSDKFPLNISFPIEITYGVIYSSKEHFSNSKFKEIQ